jgi:hypothetical protein
MAAGIAKADDTAAKQQKAETKRVDWRFAVGATYMSGFQDVSDMYLDTYGVDGTVIPVGVSFNATMQISHGNVIASMPAIGVGPIGLILTQESIYSYGGSSSSSTTYVDIPITATYGIKFLPHGSIGPYVRGGIAYHIATGDDVDSSSPGGFVAAGVEFLQKRRVGIQFEAAYDDSTVSFKGIYSYFGNSPSTKVKTGATLLSVRVVF